MKQKFERYEVAISYTSKDSNPIYTVKKGRKLSSVSITPEQAYIMNSGALNPANTEGILYYADGAENYYDTPPAQPQPGKSQSDVTVIKGSV